MTRPRSDRLSTALAGQHTPVTYREVDEWRDAGWWENRTIRSLLTEATHDHPNRTALVGRRTDGLRVTRTYAEMDAQAHRAANVLASLGVGPGDAVVLMLPNWIEYAELLFGINEIGAVYAGIPVAYGDRQAEAVLRRSRAKVLVVPRRWRSNDNLDLARRLRPGLPDLEHVVVIDDDPAGLLDGESLWSDHSRAAEHQWPAPRPEQLCYLGFTSGTTGEPKGAMHGHESLIYSARLQAEHVGAKQFGDPMVQLVASPVGHHTGFVWGVLFTVLMKGTGVHVDRWDPAWGTDVIREEGVTAFFGAPTFLQDIVRTDLAGDPGNPLACLVIAGAPIPRTLPATASAELGAFVSPAWGMTECSIITCCEPEDGPAAQRTDGSVFAGSEIAVVDVAGDVLPAGETGELIIRGPAVMYGYFDRPDATDAAFRDGLWFDTGDTASIDVEGRLSLRGRSKDIIIRGGENVPVTDIESLVFEHPDVANAAIVGIPDDRLGERVCAFVVLREGSKEIDLEILSAHLLRLGLSKHYLPEVVRCIREMPTTPSGKIQKFKLKETLA